LWYTPKLEHFGAFKFIEENLEGGFDVNFDVEDKLLTKYVFPLSSHEKPIWL
jgi:hypothetical protein